MSKPVSISENTTVRISLIILLVGGVVAGIWQTATWTSAIGTKLDNVQQQLTTLLTSTQTDRGRIDDIANRLRLLETAGTPKSLTLEKEIIDLRRLLEIHTSRDTRP